MNRSGWHLLVEHVRRQRSTTVRLAGWSVLEALPAMASGALLARALDQGFLAQRPLAGLGWLAGFALTMLIGAFATRQMFPHLAATVEPLRDALLHRLIDARLTTAVAHPDGTDDADAARLTNLAEDTRRLLTALLRTLRPLVFKLLAALIGVTALAPAIALLTLPPLLLALTLSTALLRATARRQRAVLLAEEEIARVSGSTVASVRDVLACAADQRALADIDRVIDAHARGAARLARLVSLRTLIITIGGHLPPLALLAAAPWLVSHHSLTTGQIIGALSYLSATLVPALNSLVGTIGSRGLELGVVLRRIAEATTSTSDSNPEASSDSSEGSRGLQAPDLSLHDLTFAYGPHAAPVLQHVDLKVPHGDHLAIVGASGIGKSTLAQLLAGTQRPQSGYVLLGGTALTELPAHTARNAIAVIPQQAYVFTGTLRENLTYLNPQAPEPDIAASVDAVGLRPLVERLGGFDSQLGPEGHQLSSGERQLITLARAHLSSASIVILDEATCHLDPLAEARAERAFAARPGTLIVIAHRLTSAARARRVLVLSEGSYAFGTHAQLVRDSAHYADLVGHFDAAHMRKEAAVNTSHAGVMCGLKT
ncbi:ABC transporter ATP-binding protein [Streptomyces sp. NPDC086554]|uniref:ABC transporter ATP-binding protein n=1 Tax=Streptomyces sp. NPDC086554 TaxID=3154864 RepID=UPI00343288D0